MKRLLITGFEPFGGETVNPSWEAVRRLPEAVGDCRLYPLQIPTVFGAAAERVKEEARILRPDRILCVGHAPLADNAGLLPQDCPVLPGAPAAYFSTLPVRRMAEAVTQAGEPAAVSYSAGTFVCNDVLFRLLHHFDGTPTQVGFLHVPYLPEQAGDGVPSLELSAILRALQAAVAVL